MTLKKIFFFFYFNFYFVVVVVVVVVLLAKACFQRTNSFTRKSYKCHHYSVRRLEPTSTIPLPDMATVPVMV